MDFQQMPMRSDLFSLTSNQLWSDFDVDLNETRCDDRKVGELTSEPVRAVVVRWGKIIECVWVTFDRRCGRKNETQRSERSSIDRPMVTERSTYYHWEADFHWHHCWRYPIWIVLDAFVTLSNWEETSERFHWYFFHPTILFDDVFHRSNNRRRSSLT